MGEVTRYGVKSVAGGVKKLQRRMGRTYQQGWDRAKSGVNRQVCYTHLYLQGGPSPRGLGWVDLDLGCSITLLGQ